MPFSYADGCVHQRHDLRDPTLGGPLLAHPVHVVRVLQDGDRAAAELVVDVDGADAPALAFWWLDGRGRITEEMACFDPAQARSLPEPMGELVTGTGSLDRDDGWADAYAERLAFLWADDVSGFVDDLYAPDCVVENRMRDAPSTHGRVALHGAEARLSERFPVGHRTMDVHAAVGDGDALAMLFTITGAGRSARGGIVLTLDADDRIVSDRVYWDPEAAITAS